MIPWIRGWTDIERTPQANTRLGVTLTFVAGATNAGGFLAVGQYTSHMTGVVSTIADALVLGQVLLALGSLSMLLAFLGGAMCTAVLVNWGLRRALLSAYGLPLLLESLLLLIFGLFGGAINLVGAIFVPMTVLLLCFIMGLQNAVITKVSHAEIRTTHVTGLLTDLGIELGKIFYFNRSTFPQKVVANRRKLRIHTLLVSSFFGGALLGAYGFKTYGYIATLPLAMVLIVLTWGPIVDDLRNGRFATGPH